MFTKESLELLRHRVDLAEVLSTHLNLQRSGSSFKALCPFHEEKTPSFMIQRGDSHYHCFGCGAHGDAIAFLMSHIKMSFTEAVESLAERFQVTLEKKEEPRGEKGPNKAQLKQALELASNFYHYLLLHSAEGQIALHYLYERGIDLDFIRQFQLGFAPGQGNMLIRYLRESGVDERVQEAAGLLLVTQQGRKRDFFSDRITFPIRDPLGAVIGFSARKFKEGTFGGKYINTPETQIFKKSRILFGLSYCRSRIAKEAQAIVVEGQIDCLRLIHSGFNYTVAGQGTAFGEDHVKELLHLGVNKVFLALDADEAGLAAAVKIGHLFQKKGVEVVVTALPEGADPDSVLMEWGPEAFGALLKSSRDYLNFLFLYLAKGVDLTSPSKKNDIVNTIVAKIKQWEMPVMVHESLKKLAEISQVPEAALGIGQISLPDLFIKKSGSVKIQEIDANQILEGDFIRWLVLASPQYPHLIPLARANISREHLCVPGASRLYGEFLQALEENRPCDLLTLGACLENEEDQDLLSAVMQRKVNLLKAEDGFKETIRKILIRKWMGEREAIRAQLQSGALNDEEALGLARQFDEIKKRVPEVVIP
ncbi:MAG: DNA primase [Rhabdochlamydiaceae bacterium]|jgi:DNA primase